MARGGGTVPPDGNTKRPGPERARRQIVIRRKIEGAVSATMKMTYSRPKMTAPHRDKRAFKKYWNGITMNLVVSDVIDTLGARRKNGPSRPVAPGDAQIPCH